MQTTKENFFLTACQQKMKLCHKISMKLRTQQSRMFLQIAKTSRFTIIVTIFRKDIAPQQFEGNSPNDQRQVRLTVGNVQVEQSPSIALSLGLYHSPKHLEQATDRLRTAKNMDLGSDLIWQLQSLQILHKNCSQ